MKFFKRKVKFVKSGNYELEPSIERFFRDKGDDVSLARLYLNKALSNYEKLSPGSLLAHAHLLYQRFFEVKLYDPQVPENYVIALHEKLFSDEDGADTAGLVKEDLFAELKKWLNPLIDQLNSQYSAANASQAVIRVNSLLSSSSSSSRKLFKHKSVSRKQSSENIPANIRKWDIDTVIDWLASIDMSKYAELFGKHEICGLILLETSVDEFIKIGVDKQDAKLIRNKASLEVYPKKPLVEWDEDDVVRWLTNLGLKHLGEVFRYQAVTGEDLKDISPEEMVMELGIKPTEVKIIKKSLDKAISLESTTETPRI